MSIRGDIVRFLLVKNYMRRALDPEKNSLAKMRQSAGAMGNRVRIPRGTQVEKLMLGDLPVEWIKAANVPAGKEQVILYFHSGAFCLGYGNAHRLLAAAISKACDVRVLAVDYRLAPEHPYPAANEDCLAAYRWLLNQGIPASRIAIGGDSAGGGLTLMTLLSLRDGGGQLPAAAFMLSALGGDFSDFEGESYTSRAKSDPLNSLRNICIFAQYYIGSQAKLPAFIKGDLHGLPDLLIQAGNDEVILSDCTGLAERAQTAGVNATLQVWDKMWHDFQAFTGMVPEADEAIDKIGEFIHEHLR